MSTAPPGPAQLEVKGLSVDFRTGSGWVCTVNDVTFGLAPGRTTALLGESGSGKTVTSRALLGVLPAGLSRVRGQVLLDGKDLLALSERERRRTRGGEVAMVFQDALSALNPVLPVGYQIAEGCRAHGLGRKAANERAVDLLDLVGIPGARRRCGDFPHQFSGGMRQRVMIAIALAADPRVLIADEPTTALDVTIQAQILDLLVSLQETRHMSLLLITHDLGVVAQVADDIAVMYAGRIVEQGSADDVLCSPTHPYTEALLRSVPRAELRGSRLLAIPGAPPDPARLPTGCSFRDRCEHAEGRCQSPPALVQIGRPEAVHLSRCHRSRPDEVEA